MADKHPKRLGKRAYERELQRLQVELARMQSMGARRGQARVVVLFEGRDAAGKGGTIKRITGAAQPALCAGRRAPRADRARDDPVVLPALRRPTFPAAGEIVLFDRSWYNRAGVERVLGFCTADQYHLFMRQCPQFERMLIDDGILLTKYWFSVSDEEQARRFQARIDDPDQALEAVAGWT